MGAPIIIDVRKRAVAAYLSGAGTLEVTARIFSVGLASLKRWVWRHKELGDVGPTPQRHGPEPKIGERGLVVLKGLCNEQPDRSIEELRDLYNRRMRVDVSAATIGRALRDRLRLPRKKKSYRPEQQDSPRVQALRQQFGEEVAEVRAGGSRLIFVDESGCHLGMDRSYARAPVGERAGCTQPFHRGENINIIGAIGVTSVRCMMTIDGTVDGQAMEAFALDVLGPKLRKNDVVIWDNFRGHKVASVMAAIEARGAKIIFLPPYSPDLNPIELLWSKLKAIIRRYAPRTSRAFNRALRMAINSVTRSDLRNWFRHCGYEGQPT